MNQGILDYIKSQRVGVLALEMLDGSPHGSTVHFANTENPLVFYFETSNKYRKCEPLLNKDVVRASFVVGSDEGNMKTLQMDGISKILSDDEMNLVDLVYLAKFPEKKAKSKGEDVVFFKFSPNWWRFTDWTRPDGKMIISSDGK